MASWIVFVGLLVAIGAQSIEDISKTSDVVITPVIETNVTQKVDIRNNNNATHSTLSSNEDAHPEISPTTPEGDPENTAASTSGDVTRKQRTLKIMRTGDNARLLKSTPNINPYLNLKAGQTIDTNPSILQVVGMGDEIPIRNLIVNPEQNEGSCKLYLKNLMRIWKMLAKFIAVDIKNTPNVDALPNLFKLIMVYVKLHSDYLKPAEFIALRNQGIKIILNVDNKFPNIPVQNSNTFGTLNVNTEYSIDTSTYNPQLYNHVANSNWNIPNTENFYNGLSHKFLSDGKTNNNLFPNGPADLNNDLLVNLPNINNINNHGLPNEPDIKHVNNGIFQNSPNGNINHGFYSIYPGYSESKNRPSLDNTKDGENALFQNNPTASSNNEGLPNERELTDLNSGFPQNKPINDFKQGRILNKPSQEGQSPNRPNLGNLNYNDFQIRPDLVNLDSSSFQNTPIVGNFEYGILPNIVNNGIAPNEPGRINFNKQNKAGLNGANHVVLQNNENGMMPKIPGTQDVINGEFQNTTGVNSLNNGVLPVVPGQQNFNDGMSLITLDNFGQRDTADVGKINYNLHGSELGDLNQGLLPYPPGLDLNKKLPNNMPGVDKLNNGLLIKPVNLIYNHPHNVPNANSNFDPLLNSINVVVPKNRVDGLSVSVPIPETKCQEVALDVLVDTFRKLYQEYMKHLAECEHDKHLPHLDHQLSNKAH